MATITVVNNGLSIVTNLLAGSGSVPKYIAYGIGTASAAVSDADLTSAAAEARASGTVSLASTNTAEDTFKVVGTITCASSAKAITEVGLFDNVASGRMFMHGGFDPINLNVGDSITFTISNVIDQS